MRKLEEYITVGTKRMRCGYTTGTCAAAATRAAAELLLGGNEVDAVVIDAPAGVTVTVDVEELESGDGWACAAVRKDAGDDPDVTDGILVYSRVEYADEPGIRIEGGEGVGRVTRAGLDQPVGQAAINSTPRKMILEQVEEALSLVGEARPRAEGAYEPGRLRGAGRGSCSDSPRSLRNCARTPSGTAKTALPSGLLVTISVPDGEVIAGKTFNPRLGIEGGISIIGTGGIVRPMSEEALIASIELELRMLAERGVRDLLVVPGNYGRDFAAGQLDLVLDDAVQCSNFFGATIDAASVLGFETMLIIGHIGKMAKVAGGIMNTHSRVADCRVEVLAAHAALVGAEQETVARIMGSATTDAALDVLEECGLTGETMASVMQSLAEKLAHRACNGLAVDAVVFSNVHGVLGETAGACELLDRFRRYQEDGA